MASFSFGAGNIAQILRVPLYALGRVATTVIPRSRNEWVFGSPAGLADGAWALWQEAAIAGEPMTWLTADAAQDAQARAYGVPSVRRGSLRGFWRTARARVIVLTHGFGDVNRFGTSGAYVVQLWHGIPLKRLGLDSPATTRAPWPFLVPVVRAMYRMAQKRISLLPAASSLVRGRLESAFGLDTSRVPVTGEPRVDVLSRGTEAERRRAARRALAEHLDLQGEPRVVLYAPTWRDGAPDPAIPTAAEWRLLSEALEAADAVLAVRSHPLGAGDYRTGVGERVRLLGSDVVTDVTPLLPGIDALITDYSSLLFDAASVPMPVLYLAPDAETYARERGFYGTYAEVSGGDVATSWTALLPRLRAALDETDERARLIDVAHRIDAEAHAFRDGRNTERVYRHIRAALDDRSR